MQKPVMAEATTAPENENGNETVIYAIRIGNLNLISLLESLFRFFVLFRDNFQKEIYGIARNSPSGEGNNLMLKQAFKTFGFLAVIAFRYKATAFRMSEHPPNALRTKNDLRVY